MELINFSNCVEDYESFYHSRVLAYTVDGFSLNPYKYIESIKNDDCNKVLVEI